MRAAIITAPRPGGASYLERTIREITQWMPKDDVRVFSDALEGPATIEGVPVTHATPEHLDRVRRLDCVGALNFARAADWVGETGPGCVFEDDVELAEEWHSRAAALASRADALYPRGWVLALVHFYDLRIDFDLVTDLPHAHVELLRWKEVRGFYGAQAVVLSRQSAAAIGPMIRDRIEADPRAWRGALAIKNFCLTTATPLLACNPCLAQHLGDVSAHAIGRPPVASRYFIKAMAPPERKAPPVAALRPANDRSREPLSNQQQAISRNAACPCGSGLRYKDCHGSLQSAAAPTPVAARLRAAQERLAAGNLDAAEALCQDVLAQVTDHPEALRTLGRCAYERGRSDESLRLALRAARSLRSHPLPPAGEFLVWSDLNFMFTQALTGLDGEFAARKRVEHGHRPRAASADVGNPLVTVVIVDPGDARGAGASVASVSRQTWRNVELVIAYAGDDPRHDHDFAAALDDCPFPVRWTAAPGASAAVLADAGVRAATGTLVNVLAAGHEFATTRLETMLRATGEQACAWGFSNVAFVDPAGHPVGPEQDGRVGSWSERLAAIPEADTIGYALIHQVFVAVDAGNLFFRRSLYDQAGGFRDLPHMWPWDFCMRALWLAEPAYAPSSEYRHRVAAPTAAAEPPAADYGVAQVAMFAEYYARACRDECVPPNPFAPSVAHWRMHFLKAVFHAGHVLALPIAELDRLGEVVLARLAARPLTVIEPGVNLVGFAYGEFGLAESLRALAKACVEGGIPFSVKDVDLRIKTRQADRSIAAHVVDELTHRCSVFCLNPDMLKPVRNLMVEGSAAGRHNVGYWFWELELLPREWDAAIAAVDEIWVSTRFIADAMRRATAKPVVLIPAPIDVTPSRPYTRTEFGLPAGRFLFLFSFDFNSFTSRKNPEAVIAAFRQAFAPTRRDVGLVIKSINAANQPEKMREFRELIAGDDRIAVIDGFFTRDQVSGLQAVVDAYVSLHRAEGLGLGLAESMFQGKPVIGTGYSGNLEFMNEHNSCLVDYRRVPIAKGEYIYDDERFEWAEPSIEHAAQWMRRLADDADFRTRIALRGQRDIRTRFTHAATAAAIRRRLQELGLL